VVTETVGSSAHVREANGCHKKKQMQVETQTDLPAAMRNRLAKQLHKQK